MSDAAKKVYADNPNESRQPYMPVPQSMFNVLEHLNISLYLKINNEFMQFIGPEDKDKDILFRNIKDKKIAKIYVHLKDRKMLFEETEKFLERIVSTPELDIETKCEALNNAATSLIEDIFENPDHTERIKDTKKIVSSQVALIQQNPKAFMFMSGLGAHDYYTYTHSIGVATYSIGLLVAEGTFKEDDLVEAGQGALLHDVGKAKVPWDIINKNGALTEEEWSKMKQHPEHGHAMLKKAGITSEVVLQACRNHHENMDGTGYPDQLKHDQVLFTTQVVGFADIFNALTTNRSYSNARNSFEAFSFMKEHLTTKFSLELYRKFLFLFKG